jgi:hypothetical protein
MESLIKKKLAATHLSALKMVLTITMSKSLSHASTFYILIGLPSDLSTIARGLSAGGMLLLAW